MIGLRTLFTLLALACAVPAARAVEPGTVLNTATGVDYATLEAALSEARDGERLELGSGRYEGTFTIDATVTIVGVDTGGGMPLIDGVGATVVLNVTAPGSAIEGVAITSTGSPVRPWGFLTPYGEEACVMILTDDVSIAQSTITGCHEGIYVRNARGVEIDRNVISGNHIGGIFLLNSQDGSVTANTVADNGYQGIAVQTFSFPRGIEMSYRAGGFVGEWWHVTPEPRDLTSVISEDIVISGNAVTGHGSAGILIGFAREISVLANTVVGNGGAPPSELDIAVYGDVAAHPLARGSGISIFCDAYDNLVADNLVRDNDNHGIDVSFAVTNRIERNTVTGSDWGIMIQGSYGNRLANNVVTGNAEFGIRIENGLMAEVLVLPSLGNVVVGNDLVNGGTNAFDNATGSAIEASQAWRDVAALKLLPPAPTDTVNHWDDGTAGNHYDDFDEPAEGFADADGDGVGETPRSIPGGAAIDHFPLAGVPALSREAAVAAVATGRTATSAGCPPAGLCLIEPDQPAGVCPPG